MKKCIRKRGLSKCPVGLVLSGVGVLALMAVQWPLALAMYCDADDVEITAAATVTPNKTQPVAKVDDSESESVIPEQITWRDDLRWALNEAQQQGKPVLVYFTADWCPPCQVMKQQVWPRQAVRQRLHEDYIPLMVDVDDPRQMPVLQRYGIRSMPTILVLDADGRVQRTGGFMSLDGMIHFLDQTGGH